MRSIAFIAFVCVLCASSTSALAPHPWRRTGVRPERLRAQIRRGELDRPSRIGPSPAFPAPPARWIEQPLDHHDTSGMDARTWRQRYFLNDRWFKNRDDLETNADDATDPPLAFLCVGGEGPALTPDVVTTGGVHCALMCQMAKDRGALIVALEHRFYGASQPTGDLSLQSLRFLSSTQALADAAALITSINAQYGGAMRWVSFGGSYPGMVASWLRLKFPHLVHAAVASSAPVQAQLEMRGYDEVVGDALAEADVGGSPACVDNVVKAFARVSDLLATPAGRSRLAASFHVCAIESEIPNVGPLQALANRAEFVSALTEVFPAQSNDPACGTPGCDIRAACDVMTGADGGADGGAAARAAARPRSWSVWLGCRRWRSAASAWTWTTIQT